MDFERVDTTFYWDFSVAIPFGIKAIKDTYKRALYAVKNVYKDYKIFTELVMALNHLCWDMYDLGKEEVSKLFADLFYESEEEFYKMFENDDEACRFFFKVTD